MRAKILIAVAAAVVAVCLSSSPFAQGNPDDVYWDNTIALAGGGLNGAVTAMTVYDGKLIVAGEFTTAGGLPANHIASWDGSTWSPLGSGIDGGVGALTVYNSNLIAGGGFTTAGGTSANNIASWDGSTWSPLGSGINGGVRALTVYNGNLIAGGVFTTAGGVAAIGIAAWDGTAWSSVGSGLPGQECWGECWAGPLTVWDGKLVAVHETYYWYSGEWVNISSWDGTTWSEIWSEQIGASNLSIGALAVYDDKLIALRNYYFGPYGPWSDLVCLSGNGLSQLVWTHAWFAALVVRDNELIVGGYFGVLNYEEPFASNIASFDGRAWSPLGSGLNGPVNVLTVFDHKLIVAGDFTIAGNKVAPGLATWTKHHRYVWHVAVNGDDLTGDGSEQYPFATIQHGVDSAMSSDTVLVHPGTYTGPGNRDIDFHRKDIVLMSAAGPEVTVIDCQGSASDRHRGFWFHSGETRVARVEGFTITNGYAPEDDTVVTYLGTLVYAHGGAVFCDSASSPTIKGCMIVNNRALWKGFGSGGDGGGGIFCHKSSPVLEDNVIRDNTSGSGGGMALYQSGARLLRNVIVDNTSIYEGGGVVLLNSADTLESNTISGNAAVSGGGIWLSGASPWLEKCLIAFNSGGPFACSGSGNIAKLAHCDIYQPGGTSWPGCIADQLGVDGNFSLDPMFCDTANGNYYLSGYSPCAPANNFWDGTLIGALYPNCGTVVCGDADMDGQVTAADIELLFMYYFSMTPDVYVPVGAADMNCDDQFTLNDVIVLAGWVYGYGPAPCCVPPPKRPDLPQRDTYDGSGE